MTFPAWLLTELQAVLARVRITWEPWDDMESLLPVFGKHYERGVDTEGKVWWRQFSKASGEPPVWELVPPDNLNDGRFVLSEEFEGRNIKKFDLIYPATKSGEIEGYPCRLVNPEYESGLIKEAFHVRLDVERTVLGKMREQREKEARESRMLALAAMQEGIEQTMGPDPSRSVVPQGFQQHESGLLIPTN